LALLYSAENKTAQAALEYEFALKNASRLDPKNIDIYKSLGAVYLQQKKIKEAEEAYRLILNLSPGDAQAHFYLANVYEQTNNKEKAEAQLKEALKLKPDYPEALNYLGYLYVEEGKNLEQAEAMIKKALEVEPNNGAYVDSLGWLHFKRGKYQDVILMRFVEDMPVKEVADAMEKSEGAVKVIQHRAIKALQDILGVNNQ